MTNKDVVTLLEGIALLLDLSGANPFKSRAYTNVARQIEQSEEDVETLVEEGRLRELKGVGDALEQKITEYVTTGALKYHDDLRAKFPESLFELFGIPGLGPKRIKQVYEELGIASLTDLEAVCTNGGLSNLKGFGPKMQSKLLEGIEFSKQQQGRHLYNKAFLEATRLKHLLSEEKSVHAIEIAGSLRRCKEVVKDIDLVATSKAPKADMNRFVNDVEVQRVTGHGETKSSVVLNSGVAADLRVVSDTQYPFALLHFTGSKEHNVALRQRAKDRGLKLNEYGLFKGEKSLKCKTEADVYKALEMPFVPPELREDMGEFDVDSFPELVTLDDVIGMFHSHSKYSDGQNTVEEMALAAQELGYHYLTMTDHSQSAAYAGGLRPETVVKQQKEIDKLNKKLSGFRVLNGIESDIRSDGSLDYPEEILQTFELVIVSVHSGLDMNEKDATKRIVKALENPHTTILGHPTGRLLLSRKGYPLNFEKVFDACAANNVAIEINANCHRLDLDWRHVRRAKERGLKLCIGPDAHSTGGLEDMTYGVGIARKGWLEPGDLLNCMTVDEFFAWRNS